MRAVVQRVSKASVTVEGETVGEVSQGLMVLLGVANNDTVADVEYLAEKICELRIFEDEEGKMNRSLKEIGGQMLVVSQFTLLGDCRKGRRPGFTDAAPPEMANSLYEQFVKRVQEQGVTTATGRFRTTMQVSLTNEGPVTMLLDSRKLF